MTHNMPRIKDLIERVTRNGVKTICHPRSILNDHISVATVPKNFFRGYVIKKKSLSVTESGGLITSLPRKSNLRDIEPELDKLIKTKHGYRGSYHEGKPNHNQLSWIDGDNRFMATKNETPDGISYTIRADIANEISQGGKLLVECDESFCDVLLPAKISVDLNKYSVARDGDDTLHGI